MTRYAIDETRSELIATWDTGHGVVAVPVTALPERMAARQRLDLATALSRLSEGLWWCYTHPASAVDRHRDLGAEGRRREMARQGFAHVAECIREPRLAQDGSPIVRADPVMAPAHRVGMVLRAVSDADLTSSVIADVEAEIAAVERAELDDLTGRSKQAVQLGRPDASPLQVAAADQMLAKNPADEDELLDLDPTSASAAAAHWLMAAAEVVSRKLGIALMDFVEQGEKIGEVHTDTTIAALEMMAWGLSPTLTVTGLIRETVAIGDGKVHDIEELEKVIDASEKLFNRHNAGDREAVETCKRLRLTTLDPRRPALSMLEDLLAGIRRCRCRCRLLAEARGDEHDEAFYEEVRAEAMATRQRLGLPAYG